MPDVIPPEAVRLAAAAITLAANHFEAERWEARNLARAALEAAAPLLADEIARKILAHMEAHGPGPGSPGVTLHETLRRAWRRHFSIAARVAAGAFDTREDQLRMAAQAIERGDYVACDIPEVPGA